MRRPRDMGGLGAGPIDTEEHPMEPWEKRVRVMRSLLGRRRPPVTMTAELQRGIKDLGAEDYNRLSYHECWTASIANVLIQKGVISVEELGRQMEAVRTRWQK